MQEFPWEGDVQLGLGAGGGRKAAREPKGCWNHVGDQGLVFHSVAKWSFVLDPCGDPQWLRFKRVPCEGEAAGKGSLLLNLEFDKEA